MLLLAASTCGVNAFHWPTPGKYHLVDPVFTAYHAGNFSINVDPDLIEAYARLSSESGVDTILLGGSTAEWPSLSTEERLDILSAWRTAVDKLPEATRPAILFHVGDVSIAAAQNLATQADDRGADAILIVSPCIMKPPTVQDLVFTIRDIAKFSKLPAIYYHYPGLYNVDFPMDQFLDLASRKASEYWIPTLAGVKYIDSKMKTLTNATGVAGGSYTLFNNDPLLAGMAAGSKGAISYTTIFPMVAEMRDAWQTSSFTKAREIQRKISEIGSLINAHGGKSAARILPALFSSSPSKFDLGPPRPPLVGLTEAQAEAFRKDLVDHGFLPRTDL